MPFTQSSWGQVGEAVCISILDLYGHNCHSRIPNTRQASLRGLLGQTIRPRTGRTTRIKDILPNGVGLSLEDVAARERPCRGACGWHDSKDCSDIGAHAQLRASRLKAEPRPGSRSKESKASKPSRSQAEGDRGDRGDRGDARPSSKSSAREPLQALQEGGRKRTPKGPEALTASPATPAPPALAESKLSGAPGAPRVSKAPRSRSLDLRRGQLGQLAQLGQQMQQRVERLPLALIRSETSDSDKADKAKETNEKEGKEESLVKAPRNAMQLVRPQRKRTQSFEASRRPKAVLDAKVHPQLLLEISNRTGAAVTVGAC